MLIKNEQYEFDEMVEVYQGYCVQGYPIANKWKRRRFVGMLSGTERRYLCRNQGTGNHFTAYARIRKIRPEIEINVKINGKAAKLSDISLETWNKLRDADIEQTHHKSPSFQDL